MNLTAKRVAKLLTKGEPGNHYDGQGLRLEIRGKNAASWSGAVSDRRRRALDGARLGPRVHARRGAREEPQARSPEGRRPDRSGGGPPAPNGSAQAAAAARAMTFAEAAERFIAEREAGAAWSNPEHAAQWPATLKAYALPVLGPISVGDITSGNNIFKVLEQKVPARNGNAAGTLWNTRTETAARLRYRIEAVLDWATARKYRSGDNPASWKTIGKVLVRPQVVDDTRHAALPFAEIPAFMSRLRQMEGVSARALEFLVLTATRSNEVLGARWREVDFGTAVWTVPPERMGKTKPREEHKVPLVAETLQLLHGLYRDSDAGDDGFVFIGRKAGAKLGSTAMMDVLERMGRSDLTVHGFRSSFRDWAAERTRHPPKSPSTPWRTSWAADAARVPANQTLPQARPADGRLGEVLLLGPGAGHGQRRDATMKPFNDPVAAPPFYTRDKRARDLLKAWTIARLWLLDEEADAGRRYDLLLTPEGRARTQFAVAKTSARSGNLEALRAFLVNITGDPEIAEFIAEPRRQGTAASPEDGREAIHLARVKAFGRRHREAGPTNLAKAILQVEAVRPLGRGNRRGVLRLPEDEIEEALKRRKRTRRTAK